MKRRKQSLLFILRVFIKIGDGVILTFQLLLKLIVLLLFLVFRTLHFLLKIVYLGFLLLRQPAFSWPKIIFPKVRLRLPLLQSKKTAAPRTEIVFTVSRYVKIRYFLFGFLAAIFFIFLPTLIYLWFKELPTPQLLISRKIPLTTKIYDRRGTLLYEIYADQNRTIIPLSEIPDDLKQATIAIEDKDFYRHGGFDLPAIIRAVRENLTHHKLQGGSTLTQQLVKSALLTPERTVERKVKELVLAVLAERFYSKDQILEMYLNQVPYGGTSWGVEAASQTYFGKKAKDLSLSEAALLAGLPAAPTAYSPFGAHPELAKTRQEEVLRRMIEDGYINQETAQKAKEERLAFTPQQTSIKAPHFVMYVKEQLVEKYGEKMVEQGGLRVTTSLDLEVQEKVQEIIQNEILSLDGLWVGNSAALVTSPQTGEILAMVGSKNYFAKDYDGNVNVALSLRQPGSAIKVVTYAAALENGFTPASVLDDSPITFRFPGTENYSPVNYDGKFHGRIPLRLALANSYNIPAVKVLTQIGINKMVEMGKRMGITSWEDDSRFGLSLTLGGGDVRMLDMAKVYGVLAAGGKRVDLTAILEVQNNQDETLEKKQNAPGIQVVSPGTAFLLSQILSDNFARSLAFGPQSSLLIPGYTVAVKTGTTNEKRDNWTIGYTPSYLVAVWVGNNDNSPMHPSLTSGVTGAAPIWHKIMEGLLNGKQDQPFPKPEDVSEVKICALNGLLPCEGCPIKTEYFLKGTEPKATCQLSPSPTPQMN